MRKENPFVALAAVVLLFFAPTDKAYADVSAQLEQAQACEENGQYEQAAEIYGQIVTNLPDTDEALAAQKGLVVMYITAGKPTQAETTYQQLLSDFSSHEGIAQAVYDVARAYSSIERNDKALELHQYNAGRSLDDKYVMWSQVEVIKAHIRNGDDAGADAASDRLLAVFSQQPTLPKEVYQVAMRYGGAKRYNKALELHKYNTEHCSKDDKFTMWSQVEVIKTHIRGGEYDAAGTAYDTLLTEFSQQPTLSKEVYEVAVAYGEANRHHQAVRLYEHVLDRWPQAEHAMWTQQDLAISNIELGDDIAAADAVETLVTGYADHKDISQAVYEVGRRYHRLTRYDKALPVHQYNAEHSSKDDIFTMWSQVEVVKTHIRDGNDVAAGTAFAGLLSEFSSQETLAKEVCRVGDAYINAGDCDKAGLLYRYAMDHWGGTEHMLWARAGMAKLDIVNGNDKAVEAAVERLIADFNDHPDVSEAVFSVGEQYYSRAFEAEKQGQKLESEERFRRAVAIWERITADLPVDGKYSAYACNFSGISYRRIGEYEKAIECFRKVVDEYPDSEYADYAQFVVGRIYREMKKTGSMDAAEADIKTLQAYENLIKQYPHSKWVQAVQNHLQVLRKSSQKGEDK